MTRLERIYSTNQAFHWFIVGLLFPVLSLLQLEKGLDLFQIGIVGAVYGGTVLLLELPTGGLADAIGRKRIYVISLLALFIGAGIILIAWNFVTMILGFFFWGVARALSSGSLDAWFVDEFNLIDPEENLQEALARVGVFIPLGLGVGSLVGGLLPMTLGTWTSRVPGLGIYSANMLVIMSCLVIQFCLTTVFVVEHAHSSTHASLWSGILDFPRVVATSVHYGIKNRALRLLLLSSLALGIGLMGLEVFWQPQVKDILGTDSQTWIFGFLATGYFLASSLGNWAITPICRRFQHNFRRILFATRVCFGLVYCLLALQGSLGGFTLFYWTLFIFNGMSNSPYLAIFNAQVPARQRSTLLSVQSLCEQLGGLLGSLLMGFIAKTLSISIAWLLGAEILVLSSVMFLLLTNDDVP